MSRLVLAQAERMRLGLLMQTAHKELDHLLQTDARLFDRHFNADEWVSRVQDIDFSERMDAFVARFGRLQDWVGDKWLPAWLRAMQETPGTVLEMLDRAEKLGLLDSADRWLAVRKLRNQMVHEYLQTPEHLHAALMSAHEHVPVLRETVARLTLRTQPLL